MSTYSSQFIVKSIALAIANNCVIFKEYISGGDLGVTKLKNWEKVEGKVGMYRFTGKIPQYSRAEILRKRKVPVIIVGNSRKQKHKRNTKKR